MAKTPTPSSWIAFGADLTALFTKYNGVLYRVRVPSRIAAWIQTSLPLILMLIGGTMTDPSLAAKSATRRKS